MKWMMQPSFQGEKYVAVIDLKSASIRAEIVFVANTQAWRGTVLVLNNDGSRSSVPMGKSVNTSLPRLQAWAKQYAKCIVSDIKYPDSSFGSLLNDGFFES